MVFGAQGSGKSTLVGRLAAEALGCPLLHRFQRDSQKAGRVNGEYAWAMDTKADERRGGMTTSSGHAQLRVAGRVIRLIDTPGNPDFVYEVAEAAMLSSVGVLVIDSTKRKHVETKVVQPSVRLAELVRRAGVNSFILAINKRDRDTTQDLDLLQTQLLERLGTVGIKPATVQVCLISGYANINLYGADSSLTSLLMNSPVSNNEAAKVVRGYVEDSYRLVHGNLLGQCVSLTIRSGVLRLKDLVVVPQANLTGRIKQIMKNEEFVEAAMAGDCIDVSLINIKGNLAHLKPGFVLGLSSHPPPVVQTIVARGFTTALQPIRRKAQLYVTLAGYRGLGVITKVKEVRGKTLVANPTALKMKSAGDLTIRFETPVSADPFKSIPGTGRVLLFNYFNELVFSGAVLEIH